jgi:excisionase family DNA binding protein
LHNDTKLVQTISELADRALARVARGSEIPPRLLHIDDAGRYLSVSDKTVRALIADGSLPYIQKIAGRSPYLLDIKDLDTWILRKKVTAGE